MISIIKFENVTEDRINEYLEIMQKDLNATILDIKMYGSNYDSYMVVYNSDKKITIKDVFGCIQVPLD